MLWSNPSRYPCFDGDDDISCMSRLKDQTNGKARSSTRGSFVPAPSRWKQSAHNGCCGSLQGDVLIIEKIRLFSCQRSGYGNDHLARPLLGKHSIVGVREELVNPPALTACFREVKRT